MEQQPRQGETRRACGALSKCLPLCCKAAGRAAAASRLRAKGARILHGSRHCSFRSRLFVARLVCLFARLPACHSDSPCHRLGPAAATFPLNLSLRSQPLFNLSVYLRLYVRLSVCLSVCCLQLGIVIV